MPAPPATPPSFVSIHWRSLGSLTRDEIAALVAFIQPKTLAEGEVYCDLDKEPGGVLFLGGGFVSVVSRLPSGLLSSPIVVGRGRVFGEGALSAVDPSVKALPLRITAARRSTCWVLPREKLRAAIDAVPRLEHVLRRSLVMRSAMPAFAEALRHTLVLASTPIPTLNALVLGAELEEYAPGEPILAAGQPTRGVLLLVHGKASALTRHDHGESKKVLRKGMLFGGLRHTMLVEPEAVTAVEPCTCLVVGTEQIGRHISTSPALRRVAGGLPVFVGSTASRATLILVMGDRRYPWAQLAFLAAAELAASYGDSCVLVTLRKEGQPLAAPAERDGVARVELNASAATAAARIAEVRASHGGADFVFIDPTELSTAATWAIGEHVSKVAMVVSDSFIDTPANWRADKIAWAVQLPDVTVAGDPPFQAGTVRLALDMDAIRRATTLEQVSEPDRLRLQRWVRGLSDRSVGIALGGGGAWGFAHVALIEMMERNAIPIDWVSGASFGALLGAFYCGLHKTERQGSWRNDRKAALLEAAPDADRATRRAFLSSRSLEVVVDTHVQKRAGRVIRLEGLEIPLLPVATNVGLGAEAVIESGTLGFGARCSSSFPGIFAPTTGSGFRYIDGGIVRNVPTDPLVWNGCDLVVASNIVPNPGFGKEAPPRFPGRVGRWLHEFNLLRRAEDTMRSSLILMHAASDASCMSADILYTAPMCDYSPMKLANGEAIIKLAEESVAAVEERLVNAWERLKMGQAD